MGYKNQKSLTLKINELGIFITVKYFVKIMKITVHAFTLI